MALGRRTCGDIRVSAGSASGYEGSASSFLSMKAWTLFHGDAQVFFVSVLLPFTAHVLFLFQNAGAEWKFGDRIFVKSVIFRSTRLGAAQTHLLILTISVVVEVKNLHFLIRAERRILAWARRHRRAIISERAVLSDTNGSNAPEFEYPPSLNFDLSAVRGRRRQR